LTVRALFRVAALAGVPAPYDRASLKIFYPAAPKNSAEERNSGMVPCDSSRAPFPVVVLLPGINVGPESYSWLAHGLAENGYVVVSYQVIAEEMPGYISLTPGLRLDRLAPDGFGTGPSATALQAILDCLQQVNEQSGVLQGALNMDKLIIGGHSAGGTVALLNAEPQWFSGLRGVFSYAAHTGASTALGHPPETILPIPGDCPVLLMGGTRDGVIAASGARYGDDGQSATARIEATFDEAVPENGGNSHLVLLDGANHFSFVYPRDDSTGRAFLEGEESRPGEQYRHLMSSLVTAFAGRACERDCPDVNEVLAKHPQLIAAHRSK
jgi:pimeloyl-ACP methyl ester carboxylesterase